MAIQVQTYYFAAVAVVLVLSLRIIMIAGQQVSPQQFAISLPSSYTGQGDDNDISTCTFSFGSLLSCTNEVIVDGMTGLGETPDLSNTGYLQQFLKWNYTASGGGLNPNPHISFRFTVFTLNRIDLFFLNYPAENIGMPSIQLFIGGSFLAGTGGTPLGYTISNNHLLSSDDSTTRELQLQVLPFDGYFNPEVIRLEMSFSGLYNVDWFFLSEIKFQGGTSPPLLQIVFESPQSDNQVIQLPTGNTLQLMCTVSTVGLFDWQWKHDGRILTEMKTTLATRTSVLIVSDGFADADTYTCEVKHQSEDVFTASRTLRLSSMEVGGPTPTTARSATTTTTDSGATTTPHATCTCTTTQPETCAMPTVTMSGIPPHQKEAGESCIDTSGLVVCVTVVVLAAVISIVVHIAICMLRQRQRCWQTSNGVPQEAIYEDMEGEEAAGLKMKGNEAYGFVPPGGGRVNNPPQSTAL